MNITTAIAIVPPRRVQAIAAPLIQRYHAGNLLRLPAHITILVPFAPYEMLDEAADTLRQVCMGIAPFEVTLAGYGRFPVAAYMQITTIDAVTQVYEDIHRAFPAYLPYMGEYGDTLHPHLTVARFGEDQQADISLPEYAPITFRVDRLHLLYGINESQLLWLTHDVIRLGQ